MSVYLIIFGVDDVYDFRCMTWESVLLLSFIYTNFVCMVMLSRYSFGLISSEWPDHAYSYDDNTKIKTNHNFHS